VDNKIAPFGTSESSQRKKCRIKQSAGAGLCNFGVPNEKILGCRMGQFYAEFTVSANPAGKIIISFTSVIDNPTIGGIEIIRN
jgi:hypothetical protein